MKAISLVITLVFFGGSVNSEQLVFKTEDPASRRVAFGEELVVECSFTDGFTGKVKWLREGKEIGFKEFSNPEVEDRVYERGSADGGVSELHITSVIEEDAGDYTCVGETRDSTFIERHFSISVYVPIKFENCPPKQYPPLGEGQQLITCNVHGSPKPTITWSFKGSEIDTTTHGDEYQLDPESSGLFILNVTEEDDGPYEIVAHTPTTIHRRIIAVETYQPPKVTSLEGRYTAEAGRPMTMTCNVTGKPFPKVRWYRVKEGERSEIKTDPRITVDSDTNELYFSEALESDSGVIECEAFNDNFLNDADTMETTVEVHVAGAGTAAGRRNSAVRAGPVTGAALLTSLVTALSLISLHRPC